MSVMPEQQIKTAPEPVLIEQESLVFAAASIVKELNLGTAAVPVREVVSEFRKYRLEGHRLQTLTEATGPIVLVFVQPLKTPLPHDDVLRSRFGLTRKEACVARLIADDQTNEQIAAELSISPHTARHHTERVLAKLGVKSRTKVRTTFEG